MLDNVGKIINFWWWSKCYDRNCSI